MATISVTTSSAIVGVTPISPVSSILTNINEPLFANAFVLSTTEKQNELKSTGLSTSITLMPTYAKTDGAPITTGTGGGTYWITG